MEPDMITLEYAADNIRMPCGHVIGPQTLLSYCQNELKRGQSTFTCPHVNQSTGLSDCSYVWDYGTVREQARLTADQQHDFETRLSENFLNRASGLQKCSGCMSWCCRNDLSNNCVNCPLCSSFNGERYDFCWVCLKQWKGDATDGDCGNADCPAIRQKILEHLASCTMKIIDDVRCPIVRACPRCATLLEHSDMCKHIQCTACCYRFCFICLKEENPDDAGRLLPNKCGAPWGCKNVAARQTQLAAATHVTK